MITVSFEFISQKISIIYLREENQGSLKFLIRKQVLGYQRFTNLCCVNCNFLTKMRKTNAAKQLTFSLHLLLRRDQNHHFNLTSKIIKMCKQIVRCRDKKQSVYSPISPATEKN